MNERVLKRKDYTEYDPTKIAYVEYEVVDFVPLNTDFVYNEKRTIILRNKETKSLESIDYVLDGAVPSRREGEYLQYWGRIIPECGMNLLFNFAGDNISSIVANYSAPSMNAQEIAKKTNELKYPVQIMSY